MQKFRKKEGIFALIKKQKYTVTFSYLRLNSKFILRIVIMQSRFHDH